MASFDEFLNTHNLNNNSKLKTPDKQTKLTAPETTKSTEPAQTEKVQYVNTPEAKNAYDTLLNATNVMRYKDMPQKVEMQQSYAGDVLDTRTQPKQTGVTGNTLLDNTVVPTLYGIGKGSGFGPALVRAVNGYSPEELKRRDNLAMQQLGKQNEGLVKGGAVFSSLATPIALTSVGVPAPISYGSVSVLNKAGETDDKLDWLVAGGKGAAWGAATSGLSGANNAILNKIPITNTNMAANVAKNLISPLAAATTTNYGFGKLEDAYNTARGREVANPTTLGESFTNAIPYALMQAPFGVAKDIKASNAKLQQDVAKTQQKIEDYKGQMQHQDTKYSTNEFKDTLAKNRQAKIDKTINELSKNKYLGGKNALELEQAVEQLRQGNAPQVELSKANLALPERAGQSTNNVQNVSKIQETPVSNQNYMETAQKYITDSKLSDYDKRTLLETIKDMPMTESQFEGIKKLVKQAEPSITEQKAIEAKELKKKYMQYKNSSQTYDKAFDEILSVAPKNRDGKLTKSGWLKVAENFGTQLQGKTPEEIEMNIYKSWQSARPNTKESLNRYGSAKEGNGTAKYVPFTFDEWKESVEKGVSNNNLATKTETLPKESPNQGSFSFENSKAKDKNGQLLTLYHGTPNGNFDSFDMSKRGTTTDISGVGDYGRGIYFTDVKDGANSYATGEDGKVYEVNLNLQNPVRLDVLADYEKGINKLARQNGGYLKIPQNEIDNLYKQLGTSEEEIDKLTELSNQLTDNWDDVDIRDYGYDGVISADHQFVATDPSQIKIINKESTASTSTTPPSNMPPTPPEPPKGPEIPDDTEEKIAQLLEERPQKEKMTLQDKIDDLVTSTVNRGHFVDKLAKASGNKQLMYKYDRMLSSANEGNYVVGEKQTNNEGKVIGKSVNEIWKPVEDVGKVQEFSDYLLHKLNIERMSLENVDELVKAEDEFAKFVKEHQDIAKYSPNTIKQIADGKRTIVDGKIKKVTDEIAVDEDIQELAKKYVELDKQVETMEGRKNKPVFGDSVTADDSRAVVAEYEKNYPKFKEWSNDIKTFNKNQLQNMVDAGLTTKETQELLNTMYDNYVRIHRDLTGDIPVTNKNGRLKVNSPIKKAKGGNQDILPLKDSMAQQAIEVKKAISRNLFGQELLKTLGNGEEVEDYGEVLEEGKNGEAPTFTVFENGKPVTMKINEDLYKAIKPAERFSVEEHVISKGLQKATRFQKAVLTSKNPIFAFTNFVRDLQTATVNSKDTKKMLNNYRKLAVYKFADLYENKTGKPANVKQDNQYLRDMWELYKANGGESNTYFDFEKGTDVEPKGKVSKALKTINDKIFGLNEVIEQMPRVAEFITTLENGGTIDEAMYNAADVTVNFKRGGEITKFLDRNGVSFLNASVQGLDKQIRNFTDDGVKGAGSFIIKCALLGIIPAVANHLLMGDDEDYNDLPNYIKDNYWLIKTGDDTFIRIPRGRDIPTFLGDLATRVTRAAQGEKNAFDGLADTFSNTLAPNNPLEDNIFAPLKAVVNNRAWNGSNIVSSSLQNKIPEQQYDAKTTEFAKWIGKNLNVSPKKVDYLLDQYTGGIGDLLMPLNTKYAEERGPLSAKFVTDSVKNNKNVSLFYDMKSDLEKKKSSNVATDSELYQLKYLNDANKKISELYKQMREVESSNSKDKEKREKATEIQKEINALTKDAVEKSEDYGKRAEQHYKNKTKSMN